MLRDKLIDTAIALGVDSPLRKLRAMLHPAYRYDRVEGDHMVALLQKYLKTDSNCIDIGCYRGRMLERFVQAAPQGKHIAYEPLPHLARSLAKRFPTVD